MDEIRRMNAAYPVTDLEERTRQKREEWAAKNPPKDELPGMWDNSDLNGGETDSDLIPVVHWNGVEGRPLCGAAPTGLDQESDPDSIPALAEGCAGCIEKLQEQFTGVTDAFGGEQPPNRYDITQTQPNFDRLQQHYDEHTTDCTPGDVAMFGEMLGRDADAVKFIYQWLSENLVMIEGDTPFNIEELVCVLRNMLAAINYFHNGSCATCGEEISEYLAYMRKANDEELARERRAGMAEGSPVRGEGSEPVPGEGYGAGEGSDVGGGSGTTVVP